MPSSASSVSSIEEGNATVGFVALVGLLLTVAYTLIAGAMGWYVHAVLTDSAMEGARVGIASDSAAVAESRTRDLITTTLSEDYARAVSARITATGIEVQVRAPVPGAGFLGSSTIEVRAHALRE